MALFSDVNNDAFFRSIGKPWFERHQYEDIFSQIDTNADGVVSSEDLGKYFSQFGNIVHENELKRCFLEANRKGDGKLTLEEFMAVMAFFSPTSSSLGLGKLTYLSPRGKYGKFKDQRGTDMLALRHEILKDFVKKGRLDIMNQIALEAHELSRDAPELKDDIHHLALTEAALEKKVKLLELEGPNKVFAITD